MSRQPKAPKPVKMWACYWPNGKFNEETVCTTRSDAMGLMRAKCEGHPWRKLYRRGFRCVRVTVIPDGYDANGWQPIESAPKNGDGVELCCMSKLGITQFFRAHYNSPRHEWYAIIGDLVKRLSTLQLTPTHWRPLDGPENTK